MDIGLPRLDGIAATQRIKAELPDIRVVVLTSHTTETEIIAALVSGADAYCIKGASVDRWQRSLRLEKVRPTWTLRLLAAIEHLKPPAPTSHVELLPARAGSPETDGRRLQ